MSDIGFFQGIAEDLTGRGRIRLILQPALAIVLGIRLGIKDAREGKPPFLYQLVRAKGRWQLFEASLRDAAIPLTIALVVDAILQRLTLGHIRLAGAIFVGVLLVWVPFSIARGLADRAYRHRHGRLGP